MLHLALVLLTAYLNYAPAAISISDGHLFLTVAIQRNGSDVVLVGNIFYFEDGEYINCCCHRYKVGRHYFRDDLELETVRDWIEHMIECVYIRDGVDLEKYI